MSRWLLDCWAEIEAQISAAERLSLFLDFDGRLATIVRNPAEARLDESTRRALVRISRRGEVLTTVVSGRSVDDVRNRVGIKNLVFAGNHGLEITSRNLRFVEPFAAANRQHLQRVSDELTASLGWMAGVVVENKGLTASVHFRQAAEEDVPEIERTVRTALAPWASLFRPATGHMVIEILPRTGWDKGAAVCWVNHHFGMSAALSIYLGDDRTDEDAFRVLRDAITVRVGTCIETCAKYHLTGPAEVREFLFSLVRERQGS